MSTPAEDKITLQRDELKTDLYQFGRDVEKYQQMLNMHGTLHPATVHQFMNEAAKLYASILMLHDAQRKLSDEELARDIALHNRRTGQ